MKMQTCRKITILLLLMLIIGLAIPVMNTAKAQTKFYPYIYVAPNPIGLGQSVNLGFGMTMPSQDPYYYSGWRLTVTKPNGENQTLGPFSSDSTGGTGTSFTPGAIGTWKFQAYYPGGNITYMARPPYPATTYSVPAAYSQQVTLTVDTTQLSYPVANPLPTSYWEYPISSDNAAWYNISSNWLMPGYDTFRIRIGAISGVFDPYTVAPKSAHILWTKPWMFGGVATFGTADQGILTKSSTSGVQTYYTGSNYREEGTPPVIINGRLYFNHVDPPAYGFYCLNLYNGEQIWFQNQTFLSGTRTVVGGGQAQISLGQILVQNDENQNGAVPYLWSTSGTTWARYDAYTGNLLNTIVNATGLSMSGNGMAAMFGPSGELIAYYFTQSNPNSFTGNLVMWNSTLCGLTGLYNQAQRLDIPWKNGIQWNVTVQASPNEGTNNGAITWDPKNPTMLIITNQTNGNPLTSGPFQDIAYSTLDGHVLWSKTRNTGGDSWEQLLFASRAMGNGIYTIFSKETRQLYAYSAATGDQLWVSDPRPNALGTFVSGLTFAYGLIYQAAYDGYIYAYDETTGKLVWSFYDNTVNPSGLETPYGQYPYYGALVVADGILFAANQEHTEQSPLFRGEALYAINASTGQLIWQIKGQYKQQSIAGGIMIAPNQCDGLTYAFGKGPSKTTVTAPSVGVTTEAPVTITGTITDVSAGSKQQLVAANFPNGLPCVSDDSMSEFMGAVYQQQPMPTNITGVPITLSVIDSNGNNREIGTTTTSAGGTFGFNWKPDISGSYIVLATFKGTQSYYGSAAQTYFYANEPAAIPAPTTAPSESVVDSYFIPAVVSIIVTIVIVGALIIIMQRKRP
jgi:outer membrane protein assembly factor BamB